MNRRALSFCAVASLACALFGACSDGTLAPAESFDAMGRKIENNGSGEPLAPTPLTTQQRQDYVRAISPWLIGRVPVESELQALEADDSLTALIDGWADEPGLADAARRFVDNLLFTGGAAGEIDHTLPGNIAHTVAQQGRPWSEILTAQECYDGSGNPTACDSGAPYTAGVLTTRAYLAGRASRFNLTRASTMMRVFACREYPLPNVEEPHIEKSRLLVLFRAETQEEQEDARAAAGFGNGSECYACHGQFSLHAQSFVRFDENGLWREDATGLQDTAEFAELGRSIDGLMASHLQDPEEARSEASQMLGVDVANLAGSADALAQSELFLPCQARRLIEAVFAIDSTKPLKGALTDQIAATAETRSAEPSFHDLVYAAFTARPVIDAYLASLPQDQPEMENSP